MQRVKDFGRLTLWEMSGCVISDFRSSSFDVLLFWDIACRRLVVDYRILGQPVRPNFKDQGVTKRLPSTAYRPRRAKISNFHLEEQEGNKEQTINIEHNFITYSYRYMLLTLQ
jgi:hypothetical protein